MAKERKTPDRATRLQVVQISDLLKEALIKHPDGLVEYKGDQNDDSIAATAQASRASVAAIRNEVYGRLRTRQPSANTEVFKDLTQRIITLDGQLHEMRVKYHKLIQSLALQGFKELRHLALVDLDVHGNPIVKKQEK